MKSYVFYLSDIAVNVYEKGTLSADERAQLKAKGFHKMPFDTKAEDEAQAIDEMLKHFKENHESLKEFTRDYLVPSVLFAAMYAAG